MAMVFSLTFTGTVHDDHGIDAAGARIVTADALESIYRIRVTLVAVTAEGGLVDVRFTVTDRTKAAAVLAEHAAMPALFVERSGAILSTSHPWPTRWSSSRTARTSCCTRIPLARSSPGRRLDRRRRRPTRRDHRPELTPTMRSGPSGMPSRFARAADRVPPNRSAAWRVRCRHRGVSPRGDRRDGRLRDAPHGERAASDDRPGPGCRPRRIAG